MPNKVRRFPGRDDPRFSNGQLLPTTRPKFAIESGAKIFTIGSCFAHNIEEALAPLGFDLPMLKFVAPKSEWPNRPNGLLNEYNPGTMSQRILHALNGEEFPDETIVRSGELYADLMLHGGADVTLDRSLARRKEIFSVYRELVASKYATDEHNHLRGLWIIVFDPCPIVSRKMTVNDIVRSQPLIFSRGLSCQMATVVVEDVGWVVAGKQQP